MSDQLLLGFMVVLVIIVLVTIAYFQNVTSSQQTDLTSLKTSINSLVGNVNDIASIKQLNATVQALQANAVPANTTSITPQKNSSLSAVNSSNALSFSLNTTYTLNLFSVSVTPQNASAVTFVDVPMTSAVKQGWIVSNQGTSNTVMTPSITSLIVNDIRSVISSDGSSVRIFFTSNNTSQHDLSLTVMTM